MKFRNDKIIAKYYKLAMRWYVVERISTILRLSFDSS